MASEVPYHDQGQANGTYHFKILVPSVAAGAIIGKGGGIIVDLQKETGTAVKMSKASDFYPGTRERVCLIKGTVEGILKMNEFIMKKIREKPDFNAKMAVDFDNNQSVKREKQVKILVPNCTAGLIIGRNGCYIKQIKEESGAYVQISQKYNDHILAERCITVIGEVENNRIACRMILSKIVEDPQSGCCLHVSYANINGPIANSSPTGSPFANSFSSPSGAINSNNNNSNSSPSPTITDSFNNFQFDTAHSEIVPFTGVKVGDSVIPSMNPAQVVEAVQIMLRNNGYSEHAVLEIGAAINTLANYRILGHELGVLNGAPVVNLKMGISPSAATTCAMPPLSLENRGTYTCAVDVPEIESTYNSAKAASLVETESNTFTPTESIDNGMSRLDLGPAFTPPSSCFSERFLVQTEPAVFEPFHRTSPALDSPSTGALNMHNSSVGFETGLNYIPPPNLRKCSTPSDLQVSDETKLEIEVREGIVGSILGPGGIHITNIQRFSGANIQISKKGIYAYGTRNRIVTITGLPSAVNIARYLIERKIAEEESKRAKQNAMKDFC